MSKVEQVEAKAQERFDIYKKVALETGRTLTSDEEQVEKSWFSLMAMCSAYEMHDDDVNAVIKWFVQSTAASRYVGWDSGYKAATDRAKKEVAA